MTIKERTILLKLHEQVLKLTTNPPTTFSPQTGAVIPPVTYQPSVMPLPLPPTPKYQG